MSYNKILSIFFVGMASVIPAIAAAAPQQAKDTITDNRIVPPESFDVDTKDMMDNWYLSRYAVIDSLGRRYSSGTVSDEVYIDRLQRLPVEIEMPYNQIVKQYIELYALRKPQLVEKMLGLSIYYMPIFESALEKNGMPIELKYLPVIESALDPNAISRAGAGGLWQFMPATAKDEGLEFNSLVDERRAPIESSEAAARYLKKLYGIYDDWTLAIAAYNCGPGNVNKAIKRAGGGKKDYWQIYPFLPKETRGYVPAFIAANYIMNYYGEHGISPVLARRPLVTDTVHVTRRVHLQQISDVMGLPIAEIRQLNPQYRKDIIPGHIRPYTLILPSIQAYCYAVNEDSIVNHDAEKYAVRSVVEPDDGSVKGSDSRGEYVEELQVKYHKVRKGETISSIARKYGVSTTSIRKANKLKSNRVKRGKTLKINTYRRRYIEPEPAVTDSVPGQTAPEDSVSAVNQEVTSAMNRSESRKVKEQNADNTKKSTAKSDKNKKSATYKVRKGDTLSRIAAKNGVTVDQLMKWNNLRSSSIRVGQKLKIRK